MAAAPSTLVPRNQPPKRAFRSAAARGIITSSLAIGLASLGLAGAAGALDDLNPQKLAAGADSACPALTQIKYPWITCRANEYGGLTLSIPSQPAPLACNLRLADGECAASPNLWQLDMPLIGPVE